MPRNVELEHNSAVPEHVHAITLVRHGRTAYNAQHRLQGQIDIPLDEVGQWQVRQTADALRELYVDRRPDIPNRLVICSDLGRAAATAHAFATRWAWKCIPTSACVNAASAIGKAFRLRNSRNGTRKTIVPGLNSVAANSNTVPNPRRKSDVVASKR